MRMTIGMPRTFIFFPSPEGIWIGFIRLAVMFCRTAPAGKRVYNWPVFCYALRIRQNRLATKVPRCSSRFVQESAIRIALTALFDLTELSHGDPVVVAIHGFFGAARINASRSRILQLPLGNSTGITIDTLELTHAG